MALNPYHHWLGLDSEEIHPNYFQLLGVTSNPANEDQYRLVVAAAVKSRLAKLQQIDAGSNHEPMRLLQERLVRAGQTLSDPQRRQKYVDRIKMEDNAHGKLADTALRSNVGTNIRANQDVAPVALVSPIPTYPKKSSDENPSLFPPSTAPPSNPLTSQSPFTSPVAKPAMAVPAATVWSNQPVPLATPIASQLPPVGMPVSTGAVPALPVASQIPPATPVYRTYTMPDPEAVIAPATSPSVGSNSPPSTFEAVLLPSSYRSVVSDDSGPSAAIDLRPVRRRRRSLTGVVSVVFMLAVAVVSLFFLFQVLSQQGPGLQISQEDNQESLSDTNLRQQTIAKPRPNSDSPFDPQQSTRIDTRDRNTSPSPPSTGTLADIPLPTDRPERNFPINENTSVGDDRNSPSNSAIGDDPFSMPSISPGLPPLPDDGSPDLADGTVPGSDRGEASTNDDGELNGEAVSQPTEPIVSMPTTREISPSELLDVMRKFRLIRHNLQRRDAGPAAMLIMATQLQLDTLVSDGKLDAQQQQRLQTHFQALQHTHQLLEGFWAQVKSSCRPLVTGDEVKIGEQVLGFVEANSEGVILRNAGSNIFYGFEFMPPGIAVTLAEKGAIEDIPTWRLQLAAFYCMYVEKNPDYQKKIDDLISQSEADGHDGALLREYLNTDFSKMGKEIVKQPLPAAAEIQSQLQEFEETHGKLDPKRARPSEAEMLANTLLTEVPQEPKLQIAYLEQARQLAIRSGNAYLLEDIVLELDLLANIETAEVIVESMLELSELKLNEDQARVLMETAIPYLKSGAAIVPSAKKLATQLYKIAERAGFVDSQRRLSQL